MNRQSTIRTSLAVAAVACLAALAVLVPGSACSAGRGRAAATAAYLRGRTF